MHPQLSAFGWDPGWDSVRAADPHTDCDPARVAVQHRGAYVLYTADGDRTAAISGRLRHEARSPAGFPAVGDWVLVRDGTIHAILPRRTAFSRKVTLGVAEEQVVAANIDVVFVVASLGAEPNLRRLERFLTVAYESGAQPVVLLSKSDLCLDVPGAVAAVEGVAPGTPVNALSAYTGDGFEVFDRHCTPGRTAVFLGPSGVGKTTLLNALTGTERPTAAVLEDGRGRHTTTRRELVLVAGRGLVLDTPGMRELQLWEADAGLAAMFGDIEAIESRCRFADCGHHGEPGCAIQSALDDGSLSADRYASFRKLEREETHTAQQKDARALSDVKRLQRAFARRVRRAGWRGQD